MIDFYVKNIQNAQSVLEIEKIVAQAVVDGEYDSKIVDEAEHILNLNKPLLVLTTYALLILRRVRQ